MMDAIEHGLGDSQRNIPPFVPGVSFAHHQHTRLILEKLANLISTQIPYFSDLCDGIMPLDVCWTLDLDGSSSWSDE